MQPDDVYPLDGAHFLQEPEEQAVSRKKEKARTLEAKQELENILKHFRDRILATDSVAQALELAETYKISKEQALVILDVVRKQLEVEEQYISDLLEVHAKNL